MAITKRPALALCLVGLIVAPLGAQNLALPAPMTHAAAHPTAQSADLNGIDAALRADDNFEIQQALENALALLNDGRTNQKTAERIPGWLRTLIGLNRFDEAGDFALAVINARPTDLKLIESCQQYRIRAKLLQNNPREALPLAKGLYNLCAMPNTSKAIDLISECLYDLSAGTDQASADPAGAVKRFRLEQIRGAATTQPASADATTLSQIQIDPQPYASGLEHARLLDNGWDAAMATGNLLLLSGQPSKAAKAFAKAYSLASDENLAAATEAVARAMRAEDGTVGRANAWILSLRPPEQATP